MTIADDVVDIGKVSYLDNGGSGEIRSVIGFVKKKSKIALLY